MSHTNEEGRGRVQDADLRVLIGLLASVEAALLPDVEPASVMNHLLDRLGNDLVEGGQVQSRVAADTAAGVLALNHRLRRALGEEFPDVQPG